LIAARHYYNGGKLLHFLGVSVALALALTSPLVLLFKPDLGPTLAAIAGAWIFVTRLPVEYFRQRRQRSGALAQELFDCEVLGLEWNGTLGRRLSAEEVHGASKAFRKPKVVAKTKRWYPADSDADWPTSVLICQRASAVWSRQQHRAYGWVLIAAAAAWWVFGVVVSAADDATLVQYLTIILLPSLPALLDAVELGRSHLAASSSRQRIEDQTDSLLEDGKADDQDLREIQDQHFALRRDSPTVPSWFYKILRSRYEDAMQYAARTVIDGSTSTSATEGDH
jgi:hypothetical protein